MKQQHAFVFHALPPKPIQRVPMTSGACMRNQTSLAHLHLTAVEPMDMKFNMQIADGHHTPPSRRSNTTSELTGQESRVAFFLPNGKMISVCLVEIRWHRLCGWDLAEIRV